MQPTTFAGRAGRMLGTTLALIDWTEVWATFLHGLQVTIVLVLLAGRATRHAWDSLPGLSERLGSWYARMIVPTSHRHHHAQDLSGHHHQGGDHPLRPQQGSGHVHSDRADGPQGSDSQGAPTGRVVTLTPVDCGLPAVDYASLLEALTVRDLRATCVTLGLPRNSYRSARKAELVALLADLHVNPTL